MSLTYISDKLFRITRIGFTYCDVQNTIAKTRRISLIIIIHKLRVGQIISRKTHDRPTADAQRVYEHLERLSSRNIAFVPTTPLLFSLRRLM